VLLEKLADAMREPAALNSLARVAVDDECFTTAKIFTAWLGVYFIPLESALAKDEPKVVKMFSVTDAEYRLFVESYVAVPPVRVFL
jgi:hypothetical protein